MRHVLEDDHFKITIEKVKQLPSCRHETLSIRRKKDGEIFTIGDKIMVRQHSGVLFKGTYTITGFETCQRFGESFTCVSTKEPNAFLSGVINIEVISLADEKSYMTRKCLSINDYLEVLKEQKKKFLFADKMIKFLKEKVK